MLYVTVVQRRMNVTPKYTASYPRTLYRDTQHCKNLRPPLVNLYGLLFYEPDKSLRNGEKFKEGRTDGQVTLVDMDGHRP